MAPACETPLPGSENIDQEDPRSLPWSLLADASELSGWEALMELAPR